MTSTTVGRHRAPSRLSYKPVAKAGATVVVSTGLALGTAGAGQAAPAQGATPAPTVAPQVAPAATTAPVVAPTQFLPTATYRTYRWGSRGGQVKTIQRIVGAYQDGIFGPKTHAAVKRYQKRNGLWADGIVGPKTSRKMGLSGSSSSTSRSSSSASRSSASSSSIIRNARSLLGARYRYAGSTYSGGYDCSGYVKAVFAKSGISIPRTSSGIQRAATRVSSPRPGDLVFYNYPATHVGIYAGNGMMYDSGRSTNGTTLRRLYPGSVNYGRIG
ncbi:MAG: NlpC/P60 family protein [Ornithinimicrobium sp.]